MTVLNPKNIDYLVSHSIFVLVGSKDLTILEKKLQNLGFYSIIRAADLDDLIYTIASQKPDFCIIHEEDHFQAMRYASSVSALSPIPILAIISPDFEGIWKSGVSDILPESYSDQEFMARIFSDLKLYHLDAIFKKYMGNLDKDLTRAQELQQKLLPQKETLEVIENRYGVSIQSIFTPFHFLSGDLWGIYLVDNNNFDIWIADFSGKGISAALNTFRLHTLVARTVNPKLDPHELMEALNSKAMDLLKYGEFITMLYARINVEEKKITFCSAGAMPPLIYKNELNAYRTIQETYPPLGVHEKTSYGSKNVFFDNSEKLVLFSDAFDTDNPEAILSTHKDRIKSYLSDPENTSFLAYINKIVSNFKGHELGDDLTVIEIDFKGIS